ncbi:hypothetical protein ASZ90_008691 [hydrocarbon metagenome]|uniref:Glycosyltransferase n=1 Tax=hydrocarbon metagenome TaxID=938273 RepID=A0A0W8FL65_9ZZZZ
MKFLIIQENGRNEKNRSFRECFSIKRALLMENHECDIWGLGQENYDQKQDLNAYDVILNLENYDQTNWLPDLSKVSAFKILSVIDAHVRGMEPYRKIFNKGKYDLSLHATRDFLEKNRFGFRSDYFKDGIIRRGIWFPNWFDPDLIGPREVPLRAEVGFCGNIISRKSYLELLKQNFNFLADVKVFGEDMVKAINSYKVHFNKNILANSE